MEDGVQDGQRASSGRCGIGWGSRRTVLVTDRHAGPIPHRHDRVRLEAPVGNEHGWADPTPTVVFVEEGERTWTWTWTLS